MKTSITPVTDGQKNELGNVVGDAARKGARTMVDELVKRGILHSENFQKVLGQGHLIAAAALEAAKTKIAELAESVTGRLRLISGGKEIKIRPCDGKLTIAKAGSLFRGYLDPDFVNWKLDIASGPTAETSVEVHEMVKDGTFEEIYAGMETELDKLCLTQDQIIAFVEKHKKWLRTEGYGTFFLFKAKVGGEEKYFVAYVFVDDRGLMVRVYRFSYSLVWDAGGRRRFVLPQLTA